MAETPRGVVLQTGNMITAQPVDEIIEKHNLEVFRCGHCNWKAFRGRLSPGCIVESLCRKCRKITRFEKIGSVSPADHDGKVGKEQG